MFHVKHRGGASRMSRISFDGWGGCFTWNTVTANLI
jgi:hypothetical protein